MAEKGNCSGAAVVLSTNDGVQSRLHSLGVQRHNVYLHQSWPVPGEVTCVSVFGSAGENVVVAGLFVEGDPCIAFYSFGGEHVGGSRLIEVRGQWSTNSGDLIIEADHQGLVR